MNTGKVYLIGAGPGDVDLFTLKGKAILESADVVIYDALVSAGVLSLMPENAEKIYVGKRGGNHTMRQEKISELILEKALEGNIVARLKGGDPFLFGRGGEELELLLDNDVEYEIIPGITSAISVPAYAGIPVTHRDFVSSLHIITGHTKEHEGSNIDFDALVKLGGTLLFLMGITSLPLICDGLIKAGMNADMPCAIIENGTRGNQRTTVSNLSNLVSIAAERKVKAPAIIVVGEVSSLAEKFAWRENLPLFGKRIVVTRPKTLNSKFSAELRKLGAEVIELPSIKTVGIDFDLSADMLKSFDVIAFTSAFGVEMFFDKIKAEKIDIRTLAHIKFAAIGQMTAKKIRDFAVNVDFVPEKYDGTNLGEVIETNGKVLILRAKEGSDGLTDTLQAKNIKFEDLAVYETVYELANETILNEIRNGVDLLCFTSASTVKGFIKSVEGSTFTDIKALCIGEQTMKTAENFGFSNIVKSESATVDSMISYIKNDI